MSSKDLPKDDLYKLRHSLAHIMAQAVLEIRPGTKLGFGPPIDDGFYYDFIFSEPIGEEDFKTIQKAMVKIIKANQEFEEENLSNEDALARLEEMGEPYKKEYCQEQLIDTLGVESIRFYKNGPFLDMCEGPHVEKTRDIPPNCFRLRSIAGAYWRGDERNVQMTRIYAWAEMNKEDLLARITAHEEALKRDHKKLGAELDIYTIDDDIGKGLPLWMPNGTVIRDSLENYVKELEFLAGYDRVATPHLAKTSLYEKTGHLPYYKDGMFPFMSIKSRDEEGEVDEEYVLKPMNCPHHHKIFDARMRSYKDLPIRLAEYGHCYRYEDAGAVSGLVRVRAMCMNDAHIYCTEEQIQHEFLGVMEMHKELYKTLGITDYYMRLSKWDPTDPKGKDKYVDNPEAWEKSEEFVRRAMVDSGLPFDEVKGEAAFYGPKIDFQFKTVTGREETASTNQLDFAVPERLNLHYTDNNDQKKNPYVIHRAPAGTHERFIAFLIEHFAGAFPTWLAPVQVRIIPVSEKFTEYADQLEREMRSRMIRAEVDRGSDSMGKKIRQSMKQKVANLLVVGEEEMKSQSVTWRRYGEQEQRPMPFTEFLETIETKIRTRDIDGRI